jgi:hypothetical protein
MATQEYILTHGPSHEQLFDCIRLGPSIKELRVVEFWGQYKSQRGKGGSSLPIELEGVHYAGDSGRNWFFWGRRKQITSGDRWVPMWESKYVDFCFGEWNTYHRHGIIKFGEASFFLTPVSKEEMDAINDRNI